MAGAIGKSAVSQYFFAEQPYAPHSGPGWQVYNKDLLALSSVPKPAQWSTDSYTMTHYDSVIVMALAATDSPAAQSPPGQAARDLNSRTHPALGREP
jgi:hypothetical protein